MLSKREIMSVGTIVRIRYENDGKDTLAVIVGHLSLSKQMKCHYDYICVEYPYGIEKGIFYINHSDILETLYHCTDYQELHCKWMERKYGDYLAYYKHYRVDLRPDKNEMRKRHIAAKNLVDYYTPKLKNIIGIISVLIGIGIGITALFTHQWLAVPGAVIFVLVAVYMFKKKD